MFFLHHFSIILPMNAKQMLFVETKLSDNFSVEIVAGPNLLYRKKR